MTDSNSEGEYECGICQLDHDAAEHPFVKCTNSGQRLGDGPHRFCNPMFRQYILSECHPGGAYSGVRTRGDLRSESGHLPCPLFMTGECECTSIPEVSLLNVFAVRGDGEESEVAEMELRGFLQTRDRITLERMSEEKKKEEERQFQARENETAMDRLRHVVTETLSIGGGIRCPQCRVLVQKNDACIQMVCSQCSTSFCYCCGRRKQSSEATPTDDHAYCTSCGNHLFIEEQDECGDFAIGSENAATGALCEFHRRRMAYCIKQIKYETTRTSLGLWERFRAAYPEILDDVPTRNRRIEWEEIDEATAPLFGTTQERDLAWVEEGREILNDLKAEFDRDEEEQKSVVSSLQIDPEERLPHQVQQNSGDSMFCFETTRNNHLFFRCAGGVILVAVCSVLLATADSSIRTTAFIGISGFVTVVVTTLSEHAVDAMAVSRQQDTIGENVFSRTKEVQFFGAPHDVIINPVASASFIGENGQPLHQYSAPFLSRPHGRWRQIRRAYFATFPLLLGLGSISVTNSSTRPRLTSFGWFLISSAVLYYTAATVIVNIEAPPLRRSVVPTQEDLVDEEGGQNQEADRDSSQGDNRFLTYLWVVARICFYIFLLTVGLCLRISSTSMMKSADQTTVVPFWLIGIAIGAVFAELLPRLVRGEEEPRTFSHPVGCWPLGLSHVAFCFFASGLSLLMTWYYTSSTEDQDWGSVAIVLLVIGLIGIYSLMEWFAYVHVFDRFSCTRVSLPFALYAVFWLSTLITGSFLVSMQDVRVHSVGVAILVFVCLYLLTIYGMASIEVPPILQENGNDNQNNDDRDRRKRYFQLEAQFLTCVVVLSLGSGLYDAAIKGGDNYNSPQTTAAVVLVTLGVCSLLALATPYYMAHRSATNLQVLSVSPQNLTPIMLWTFLLWFAFGCGVILIDRTTHFFFGYVLAFGALCGFCFLPALSRRYF